MQHPERPYPWGTCAWDASDAVRLVPSSKDVILEHPVHLAIPVVAVQRSAGRAECRSQHPQAPYKSAVDPSAASPHAEPGQPGRRVPVAQVQQQPLLPQSPQFQAHSLLKSRSQPAWQVQVLSVQVQPQAEPLPPGPLPASQQQGHSPPLDDPTLPEYVPQQAAQPYPARAAERPPPAAAQSPAQPEACSQWPVAERASQSVPAVSAAEPHDAEQEQPEPQVQAQPSARLASLSLRVPPSHRPQDAVAAQQLPQAVPAEHCAQAPPPASAPGSPSAHRQAWKRERD